ncbi:MAG: menaquinone biosynthesis protein [Thermodesulfovibrionales bacterium]
MKGLKVGKINYLNLFPVFKYLEEDHDAPAFEVIEGVPSILNKLLREGMLDISPSSSIEYLRNRDMYDIIEGHSISSFGTIQSILLFSDRPIEKLNRQTILTSSQSETSVVLLDIILRKFYGQDVALTPSDIVASDALKSNHACLLIGDDALIWRKRLVNPSPLYVYDLGEIWFKNTGLPFVFALWIVRKDSLREKGQQIQAFKSSLDRAKAKALNNFEQLASESYLQGILSKEEIVSYWKQISFDLGSEHIKGLELFASLAGLGP